MIKLTEIKMDYLKNPVGVSGMPQFGWRIESDARNVVQDSYQLQIASTEEFGALVYDSDKVASEESAHVFVKGVTLESAHTYYVRVRIWSTDEAETPWSETAFFVTGLLRNEEWKAEFISAESQEDVLKSNGTYVRCEFTVRGKVKEAYSFTTALGLYKWYLNGKKVGSDEMAPGFTSYKKHLLFQTNNITEYLQEGQNAVGALLGAGWYKGKMGFLEKRNNYGTQTAFLGQILIRYEDGTSEVIVTDETWKGSDAPILFSEIYDGELYDARLEQDGWAEGNFDDSTWRTTSIVDFDKKVLTAQAGCRVKVVDEMPAKQIFVTPEGDHVIDFGQNLTGWIQVKVKGECGEKVELNCFEVLDAAGNVYRDNLRSAKQTITYICKGGQETSYHPSFTFQGFRYAKIAAFPGGYGPENFKAYTVHSDMEPTGTFVCSNQDLNQLQSNIRWSLKGNFLDIPSDCPQRNERLGWTGDAQIFCRTASYLMNTYTFFSKWLKDVEADQTSEGGIPHIVPDLITGKEQSDWLLSQGTHSAAAWADAAVINPWTLYLTYGDTKILEEQYECMKKWILFMKNHAVDGIWNYKLQFGDWVALDAEEGSYFGATPNDLTCTAYYVYSTGLFVKIAKILGKDTDYREFQELHKSIKNGFQQHFFDDAGNMTVQTQTAHIIALYFELVPKEQKGKIADDLVKLLEKEKGHLVTGFVGTPYFCHALSQNGHLKEAYELLLKDDFPSWLYQIKKGATTIWEHWDGLKPDGTMWSPDMNSFNHYAYGAIGEWLYRVVAGIEIDEDKAGYKHAVIYPRMGGGLTFAQASYKSVYGNIETEWKLCGGKAELTVVIPPNTTASVCLENTVEIEETEGILFKKNGSDSVGVIGSGFYRFVWTCA